MKHQYHVDIRWSEEDEAFLARVPELEGVVTHGATAAEAAKHAEEAIELHLESLAAHNKPAPEPIALAGLSGKYLLRMGKERHQDMTLAAAKAGMSLNEYLVSLIDASSTVRLSPRAQEKLEQFKTKRAGLKAVHVNKPSPKAVQPRSHRDTVADTIRQLNSKGGRMIMHKKATGVVQSTGTKPAKYTTRKSARK